MIPKKIHYCWFGRGPKSDLFYKCYESWKKYYPDFEIIEWNEDNFDINSNQYMKEAYELKKWAFVSDYARLKILYEFGGIYFDTDVEVLKRIPDDLLKSGYLAKENDNHIATGLGFAVEKKSKIIKYMLDDYDGIHFVNDGMIDLVACPIRNTKSLIKRGYIVDKKNSMIDDLPVFDRNYFCGYDLDNHAYIISDKTYTVHHYEASWTSKKSKRKKKIKKIFSRILGLKNYDQIRKLKNKLIKK